MVDDLKVLNCPDCGQPLLFMPKGFACPGGYFCVKEGLYVFDENGKKVPE